MIILKGKLSTGNTYCLISAFIIFVSYIGERFVNIFIQHSRGLALGEAFFFSLMTFAVYMLLVNSQEPFYGILIAAFGFRMMPPNILGLINSESMAAGVVYYIVEKMAMIIFAFAILRLYKLQDPDDYISPLSIIAILVLMPFANDVTSVISNYLLAFTGKMYASYFASFAIFTAVQLVLLFLASQTTNKGARFICNFQIVALLLNFARKITAVIIMTARAQHVSKSYYVWIVIYAFFDVVFILMSKKRKDAEKAVEA